MSLSPERLTHALSDSTRLRILVLLQGGRELCVCELTAALAISQPKISRHLAVLRKSALLLDRRAGQWVHYRLHPEMPAWAAETIGSLSRGCIGKEPYQADHGRLRAMSESGTAGCAA